MDPGRPLGFLAQLQAKEHDLLQRHHIRLRIDKVTDNGRYALCVAGQVQSRLLRPDLRPVEIIALSEVALSTLYRLGLSPLIGTMPCMAMGALGAPDPDDPFLLRTALRTIGLGSRLPEDAGLGTPT